jgi:hypothetical protein
MVLIFANLLVKTREGRPIKIDNNTIAGAKFGQMQEFMLRYFHCMTAEAARKLYKDF